ncbi:MAG TPA: hypothetical protein VMW29_00780 [Candidatus Bathyarchaeia archaeon]|nr:hypothetical protein [Candidatus Bathyarchaeia archaeon]
MTQTIEVDKDTLHLLEEATPPGGTIEQTATFAAGLGLYFRGLFAEKGTQVLLERRDVEGEVVDANYLDPAFVAL